MLKKKNELREIKTEKRKLERGRGRRKWRRFRGCGVGVSEGGS